MQAFFPVIFSWPTEKWEEKSRFFFSGQKQNGIKNSWMLIFGEVEIFVFFTSDCLAKFLLEKEPADRYLMTASFKISLRMPAPTVE